MKTEKLIELLKDKDVVDAMIKAITPRLQAENRQLFNEHNGYANLCRPTFENYVGSLRMK